MKNLQELFPSIDSYRDAPASDEIEVTVIGPGYGECAIVHLGDDRWIVVDSCTTKGSIDPAPLRYLHDLGVEPSRVSLIVVTHWDDDHCKGIARLVETCPDSQLAMSKAFVQSDFLAFVAAYASPLTRNARAGVKEIKEVTEGINATGRTITGAYPARRLLSQEDISISHGLPFEVWTLSPSDREYDNFLTWVAQQMPGVGETRRVAVKRIRNDLSVVLHISVGTDVILLGGDLEEEGDPATGWSAVLALSGRPSTKAHVFKVPHHGSKTGHHNDMPSDLLATDSIAVVAPFKNGSVSLPSAQDVTRICAYAPEAYATTSLSGRASPKRDSAVDKTIRDVTKRFTTIRSDPGMIRLRKKAGEAGAWRVEKFGNAVPLSQIY